LPESIYIDVSTKKFGDKIIIEDLKLGDNIKIHADQNEILAVVVAPKEFNVDTAEEDKAAE
jgi:large subunit ribosomal protein L25